MTLLAALIGEDDTVENIVAVDDKYAGRVAEYLHEEFGREWVESSHNGEFRRRPACKGGKYLREDDVFLELKPYPSWVLDSNFDWTPPVPCPKPEFEYAWDEEKKEWFNWMQKQTFEYLERNGLMAVPKESK